MDSDFTDTNQQHVVILNRKLRRDLLEGVGHDSFEVEEARRSGFRIW